ncbi:MAG: hypothetical protein QF464_21015, partial [Myxococcota bacterium]|nr:hypothetical protein [Myxococcota bacterium]
MNRRAVILGVLSSVALSACSDHGANKAIAGAVLAVDAPFGPAVVYDPLRQPVPEIPFPNDLMLRPSDETATGVAWNISAEAPTVVERRIRREMGKLDGFGIYSPVFVPFDGPIALETVTDASVMLINIEPDHPRRGERVVLDLGRGHFPETMPTRSYWPFDPNRNLPDLFFAPDNEADTDGDGVSERVTHWEVETNTLILRPVKPLAPGCRHAVLLTRDVLGAGVDAEGVAVSAPVRSPWLYKAHASQAAFVKEAAELVELDLADLAFGWTYTTTDAAKPMLNVREGVWGRGPLAKLGEHAPAHIAEVRDTGVIHDGDIDGDGEIDNLRDHPYILQGEFLGRLFDVVGGIQPGLTIDFTSVDYFAFGSFHTPDLRTG